MQIISLVSKFLLTVSIVLNLQLNSLVDRMHADIIEIINAQEARGKEFENNVVCAKRWFMFSTAVREVEEEEVSFHCNRY